MVTADSVVEIANNVGLIAALLYTVVTALPGAITWDELDIVDYHYKSVTKEVWNAGLGATFKDFAHDQGASEYTGRGTPFESIDGNGTGIYIGKYGCQYSDQYPPWMPMSVRLGNQMAYTGTWLAAAFFLAVLLIISVSSLTRVKRDITATDMEIPEDALEAWYWWARYHIIFMLLCLVWGVTKTLLTLSDVYYLKFPQPWLQNLCKDNGWVPVEDSSADGGMAGWEPRDEMPNAIKYVGGRFVKYQSSMLWRGFKKEIKIGDGSDKYPLTVTGGLEHLDPGRDNGQSPLIILGFIAIGAVILGYAQACADSNAKNFHQELERVDYENKQTNAGRSKSRGTRSGTSESGTPSKRATRGNTHESAVTTSNAAFNGFDATISTLAQSQEPDELDGDDNLSI